MTRRPWITIPTRPVAWATAKQVPAWIQFVAGEMLSEDDVKAYCRDQIAHCKVPHRVQFFDTFPMTVTGKIQKHEIREQAIAEQGL